MIKDKLYPEALWLLLNDYPVSTSFLQRYYGIGYVAASSIVDGLKDVGILSNYTGNPFLPYQVDKNKIPQEKAVEPSNNLKNKAVKLSRPSVKKKIKQASKSIDETRRQLFLERVSARYSIAPELAYLLYDCFLDVQTEKTYYSLKLLYTNSRNKSVNGYVYVLKEINGKHYKIGHTKNPNSRMQTFKTKLPFKIEFDILIETEDMYALEKKLHKQYSKKRIEGEWFALSQVDLDTIRKLPGTIKSKRIGYNGK